MSQQKLALLLEYDGSGYHGSQYQRHHEHIPPTIQSAVLQAFKQLGLNTQGLMFSGRTDAGVHARGQVAHVRVANDDLKRIPLPANSRLQACEQTPRLANSLNAVLPKTIRVKQVAFEVPEAFHAQHHARWRWYRYSLYRPEAPHSTLWCPKDAVLFPETLDVQAMQQAARMLVGQHDFKAFQCPDTPVQETVCQIARAEFLQDSDHLLQLDIVSNRFLYKMVRNLMGLFLAIGQGRVSPQAVQEVVQDLLLTTPSRQQLSKKLSVTAPPGGLSLMAVEYPEPYQFFASDIWVSQLVSQLQALPKASPSIKKQ